MMVFKKKNKQEEEKQPTFQNPPMPRAQDLKVNEGIAMIDLDAPNTTDEPKDMTEEFLNDSKSESEEIINDDELMVTVVTTKNVFVNGTLIKTTVAEEKKKARLEL